MNRFFVVCAVLVSGLVGYAFAGPNPAPPSPPREPLAETVSELTEQTRLLRAERSAQKMRNKKVTAEIQSAIRLAAVAREKARREAEERARLETLAAMSQSARFT